MFSSWAVFMRNTPGLLFVALMLPMVADAGDLLALYDKAQKNDATFNAAQYARDAALQSEPAARALLLPQINGSYQWTEDHSDTSIGYVDPTTGMPVTLNQSNGGRDTNLSVVLNQPLFDLEHWYRLQEAGENTALAQLNYRAAQQSLILRVAEDYFGVLASYDAVRSTSTERDALADQLELAKQNMNVGISSITDVQDVQARYDLSVANALDAEQKQTAALEAMAEITKEPMRSLDDGRVRVVPLSEATPPQRLAALREDAVLPVLQTTAQAAWVKQASTRNFDVMAALLKYHAADHAVGAANSKYLPTVKGTVGYNDINTQGGGLPTKSSGVSWGVGVTVPIFAGGATRAAAREATAIREQRLAEYDGAQRLAERNAGTAYQAVMIGAARVRAYQQAMASSISAFEASRTGLEIGTRSRIDVLNSQSQRYQAERNYASARYDYLLAILRLQAVSGGLQLRDLELVDRLLVAQ